MPRSTAVDQLHAALPRIKPPAMLKTRRLGYDGKGQMMIRERSEAQSAWQAIGTVPAVLEGLVLFEREVSVIVVRGQDGALQGLRPGRERASERHPRHQPGAGPHRSTAIAVEATEHRRQGRRRARPCRRTRVELFEREGESPASSSTRSPRACIIQVIGRSMPASSASSRTMSGDCGWPLGDTARHSNAVMTNLIGADVETWHTLAAEPGPRSTSTARQEARPGRKMGHVTRLSPKS